MSLTLEQEEAYKIFHVLKELGLNGHQELLLAVALAGDCTIEERDIDGCDESISMFYSTLEHAIADKHNISMYDFCEGNIIIGE
jgi:hypothetical protein